MNDQKIKGKWTEFKGEVQNFWGELSGDDLDRTEGNVTAIGGILQQKYGELKEEARAKFDQLVAKYSDKTADASEDAKNAVRDADSKTSIQH